MNNYSAAFEAMHEEIARENAALTAPSGHPVAKAKPGAAKPKEMTPHQQWALAVQELPSAQDRPSALRMILDAHSPKSMSVEKADSFLRSLKPEERAAVPQAALSSAVTSTALRNAEATRKAKRLVEVRLSSLRLQADRGDQEARYEERRLAYALRLHGEQNMALGEALRLARADVSTLAVLAGAR